MATINHVPISPDLILAVIERHRAEIRAYHDAPSLVTNDDYDAATDVLAIAPCSTRFGAVALAKHLHWWLSAEVKFSADHQPAYGVAMARLADLRLFLGHEAPPAPIPQAFPSGRVVCRFSMAVLDRAEFAAVPEDEDVPGSVAPWQAVSAIRSGTAFCRARVSSKLPARCWRPSGSSSSAWV